MTAFYIHYPYCLSKCPYCDFNSHVSDNINYQNMLQSYRHEIDFFAENIVDNNINSIFFGGGTPSLMPVQLVAEILQYIYQKFTLRQNCEISLEANPTSVEADKFKNLKSIGINRISLGIQAFNANDLKFLGRTHCPQEAKNAIKIASDNFTNFSFDLIYARPKQTTKEWLDELREALNFQSPHLSLYQLTIEKGTVFFSDFNKNKFSLPNEDQASELFEKTNELMQQYSYHHYEISNYCQPKFACLHNLAYWQSEDYIGIGAGAHSRVYLKNSNYRHEIIMEHEPNNWQNKNLKNGHAIQQNNIILSEQLIEEIIMMGLRLESGINESIFKKNIGKKFNEIFDAQKLDFLLTNNFLQFDDSDNNLYLKIPQKNRILTNSIIHKLINCICIK